MKKGATWFKMHISKMRTFDVMPDAVVGRAMKYACAYFETGEIPEIDDSMVNIAFSMLKDDIDEAKADYDAKVTARAEAKEHARASKNAELLQNNDKTHTEEEVEEEVEEETEEEVEEDIIIDNNNIDNDNDNKNNVVDDVVVVVKDNVVVVEEDRVIQYAKNNLAAFSKAHETFIRGAFKRMEPGLVQYAIDQAAANGSNSFSYVHMTLESYQRHGFHTAEEAQTWDRVRTQIKQQCSGAHGSMLEKMVQAQYDKMRHSA